MFVIVVYKDKWWVKLLRRIRILPAEIRVQLGSRKEWKRPMYMKIGRPYEISTRDIMLADFGDEIFVKLYLTTNLKIMEAYCYGGEKDCLPAVPKTEGVNGEENTSGESSPQRK